MVYLVPAPPPLPTYSPAKGNTLTQATVAKPNSTAFTQATVSQQPC